MANEDFKQALGKIILQLRSARDISQERLALDAEVDRTRVGEIERGEANVTIDTLNKIASILGQKLGALIVEAEELSSGVIKKVIPTIKPEYIIRRNSVYIDPAYLTPALKKIIFPHGTRGR